MTMTIYVLLCVDTAVNPQLCLTVLAVADTLDHYVLFMESDWSCHTESFKELRASQIPQPSWLTLPLYHSRFALTQ
jgi:hypothetical protein